MSLYFLLGTLTFSGQTMVHRDPDLVVNTTREINVDGAMILGQYAVLGRYDFVMMADAVDNDTVARLSVEIGVRDRPAHRDAPGHTHGISCRQVTGRPGGHIPAGTIVTRTIDAGRMMTPTTRPKAMTIAGSDSGGGAGVQADLKTFAALGVYGASTLTAITAQNTVGVTAVYEIPTDVIRAQIDAVLTDIGADAVKTGMLSSSAIIECVADALEHWGVSSLVVDPVMVAKSGDSLLQEEAVGVLRSRLLPLASVVTPNIPEAEVLTGMNISSDADVRNAAQAIVAMGAKAVVVKGGHRERPAHRPFLRRRSISRIHHRQDKHAEYPRHRLHLRLRRSSRTGQGLAYGRCRRRSQGIRDRGYPAFLPHRPGPRPAEPLMAVVGRYSMNGTGTGSQGITGA